MADRLSSTFSALADPTRRAILLRLRSGEVSVKELGQPVQTCKISRVAPL